MPQTIQGVTDDGTYRRFKVASDGSFAIASQNSASMFYLPYDYISATYPNGTTEVYTTRQGGASGSIQEVITVVFTSTTKENISSVARA